MSARTETAHDLGDGARALARRLVTQRHFSG
jgi:hypothetical protein